MARILAITALITLSATSVCDDQVSLSNPFYPETFGHQLGEATHDFKEYIPRLNTSNDLLEMSRVERDYAHQFVFVFQQKKYGLTYGHLARRF